MTAPPLFVYNFIWFQLVQLLFLSSFFLAEFSTHNGFVWRARVVVGPPWILAVHEHLLLENHWTAPAAVWALLRTTGGGGRFKPTNKRKDKLALAWSAMKIIDGVQIWYSLHVHFFAQTCLKTKFPTWQTCKRLFKSLYHIGNVHYLSKSI